MATTANPGFGRMPKLTYRNRITDGGSRPDAASSEVSSLGLKMSSDQESVEDAVHDFDHDSMGISVRQIINSENGGLARDPSSLHRPASSRQLGSRPSTARTNSSNDSSVKNEDKSSKKKKSSVMDFLTLKEPSTRAFEEFAEQERRKAAAKGNPSTSTLPGVSSQRLPSTIPKVNSKWDGMPRESEAAKARRLASRRKSTSAISGSLQSHSQISLSHSVATASSSESGRTLPGSRVLSLRTSDEKTSTTSAKAIVPGYESTASPSSTSQTLNARKVTSDLYDADSLTSTKDIFTLSLLDPSGLLSSDTLDTLDRNPDCHNTPKTKALIEAAKQKDYIGHNKSPSREYKPKLVTEQSWPTKPLHSPSGSHDAHIHPALRESGRIYDSESSNSSSEMLSKHGSGVSTPRDASPMTPTNLSPLRDQFLDTVSMPKLSDGNKTGLGENWPLPGPDIEPTILQHSDDEIVVSPSTAETERRPSLLDPRDSGYAEDRLTSANLPKEERPPQQRGSIMNFSRRDSVLRSKNPIQEHAKSSGYEAMSEDQRSEEITRESLNLSPGDFDKSIHLGVGFNTDDIASIAESQAPSEMSARWYKAPKERLGLGSRMLKKDTLPWSGQDDEQLDKKRRFPVPLFGRN